MASNTKLIKLKIKFQKIIFNKKLYNFLGLVIWSYFD